ncbi:stealth family protein [Latilactobacillus sakei]|uniref:stealth family protein n=1 Tax=Latilactobacillus sakei TaxID=1599 RepID=UPI003F53C128
MGNIDFVVTWVDGNDKEWLKSKAQYQPENKNINSEIRYRDFGTFKYWFRSVEKYAPWVNKIYLVTAGHVPEWLDINSDKLVIVKHSDYMPKSYLPTFSSNPIELNLHRISELSEHFVVFNDDLFLMNNVSEDDFFHNGLPREVGIYSPVVPYKEFSNTVFNNVRIINEHFNKNSDLKKNWKKFISAKYGKEQLRTLATLPWGKITGYRNLHLTRSHLKSTFKKVWDEEYDILNQTSKNRFRTLSDVNQWLFSYWQIETGQFYPQSVRLGKYYTLTDTDKIIEFIKKSKQKELCINDDYNITNYENKMNRITESLQEKFPQKSHFEK